MTPPSPAVDDDDQQNDFCADGPNVRTRQREQDQIRTFPKGMARLTAFKPQPERRPLQLCLSRLPA